MIHSKNVYKTSDSKLLDENNTSIHKHGEIFVLQMQLNTFSLVSHHIKTVFFPSYGF